MTTAAAAPEATGRISVEEAILEAVAIIEVAVVVEETIEVAAAGAVITGGAAAEAGTLRRDINESLIRRIALITRNTDLAC